MQYLKFTYVDAVTSVSVATKPATNGTRFPDVSGLEFVWARESAYPTPVPEFFGTCPDGSPTQVEGVLGVFSQLDWEQMQLDEAQAKSEKTKEIADTADAKAYTKLKALKTMTPTQVMAWVDANVTNLAEARDAIKTLAVAVSILSRRL